MMSRSRFGLIMLLIGATSPVGATQVYKWTDENGVIHYDQAPHANGETLNIPSQTTPNQSPSVPDLKTRLESQRQLLESMREERIRHQEAREKAKREKAEAVANCNEAKSQLNTYKMGGRIVTFNERGERQFLSDEDRNRGIREANKLIARWCK